jgi:peptidoglycan/xylan/chitin deacetylase (PgdA/CDA1 family)
MRLAAMACALAIVVCVAVFGAILSQRSSVQLGSASPAQAAAPEQAKGPVVTTIEEQPVVAPAAPVVTAASTPTSDSNAPQIPATAGTSVPAAAGPISPGPTVPPTAGAAPAAAMGAGKPAAVPSSAPSTGQSAPTPVATAPESAAATPAPAAPAVPPPIKATSSCLGNPDALGVSRVVEIDTTGGAGFGSEHFKSFDFLREGEIVLTFDDGPWPKNTEAVLAALTANCTKAIFFPIGLHATYEPSILKKVAAAGHAIGSHTWCHQDLSRTKGTCLVNGKREAYQFDPKDEIEKGISAVHWAVGGPTAPYFRFPALRQPPELIDYLGKRNIGIFSADMDSFDFKMRKPEQVKKSVMEKLKKHGKGIILMHDFQHATAEATADLLKELKAGGYKVVFMKPKFPVTTLPEYDEMILKQMKTVGGDGRPMSSVIRDISD